MLPEGYKLYFAEDGVIGLQQARKIKPDLILLDVMMPRMLGFEVCRHLREEPQMAELPIVMITSLDDRKSRLKGIEAGADDFMSKPFDRAELKARVRTITRLNRYRRLMQTEEQLSRLANYDALTGLPNRSLLSERLQQTLHQAQQHQKSFTVLELDLDGFKHINETLGQMYGDRLLQYIARRLSRCVRAGDTVARVGSDEFVIITEPVNQLLEKEVSLNAQHFLDAVSMPILLGQHEIVITASIGIALYPSDSTGAQTLLEYADTAMAKSKQLGKNTYQFFTTEMSAAARERLFLENELRKALNREELQVYYQPVIDLRSGQIIGVEALTRWLHPEHGLLSPYKFIPVAEEMGLISMLGTWVLYTACRQIKSWQSAGYIPLHVAVNVSPRQFRQSDLINTVQKVLTETNFPSERLELEITESLLLHDELGSLENALNILGSLRKVGVKLALDDFGTGYSSLVYLKRFPVDCLKIDQSFIRDVTTDANSAELVKAMIAIAHSLNMKVIAEGIENEEQKNFLLRYHCDEGQGYLFSRPLPPEKLESLLPRK